MLIYIAYITAVRDIRSNILHDVVIHQSLSSLSSVSNSSMISINRLLTLVFTFFRVLYDLGIHQILFVYLILDRACYILGF